MARYELKAVSLRTGQVLSSLPLVNISATRALDHGDFSASLKMPTVAPDGPQRDADLEKCRNLIAATTPDVMTVIVLRDGNVMGEWWITGRDRNQSPIALTGKEIGSWFYRAAVDGFTTLTNQDQLTVAVALANNALAKPFAPPILVEDPGLSGLLIDKAEHPTGSAYIGDILDDYGNAIDGFDWWVDTDWDNSVALPTVKRTLRFGWPRRGRQLQGRIHVPARHAGQSGVRFGTTEDGSRVATTVYVTGTGEGDTQLVSRGQNNDLYDAYPSLDRIDNRSDFDSQALMDATSAAIAAATRSPDVPSSVRVRADGDFPLGLYSPGDSVPLKMDPWQNYPDGYDGIVRISSYTIAPPSAGATEIVDVQLVKDDAGVFDA